MQEEDVWEEFSLKAARLRRLSLRWVGTCLIVLVLMRSFVSLFPPVSAWLVWLAVWATKGVVDVLEDVKGARDRSKALWIFSSLIGFVMGVWLPTTHEILLVCTTVMVVAALFSGGIDRGVWRVAAGLVVCGCVVGFQRFWSKLSGQDGLVLLAGATVFALLESLQDRFWSSDSSGFLVRLKLIPTLAVTVMAVTIVNEAALARATFAFVLCSPHFIVYDIAKLGTCLFLLDRKNDQGAGPAVLSQRMREMLLYLMVFLATGRSSLTVRDPIVAARVLSMNEDKGDGMETFVSLPAWNPILPTESVSGALWKKQRIAFNRVLAARTASVASLVSRYVGEAARRSGDGMDSPQMLVALARVLHEFVFDTPCSDETARLWADGSVSFRARVAIKDFGDPCVQRKCFECCSMEIDKSSDLKSFLEGLSEVERVSVILQPFIISPLINLSDALVAAASLADVNMDYEKDLEAARKLISLSLLKFPPFPIFERLVSRSPDETVPRGCHVFIFADEMSASLPSEPSEEICKAYDLVAFGGIGSRACPGKSVAITMLVETVRCAFVRGKPLRLHEGHRYSGRQRDGQDQSTRYFIQTLVQMLLRTVLFRIKNAMK